MDQATLVDSRLDDGLRIINELVRDGVDIQAACWVKTGEDGKWLLYLVSALVEEKGVREAYRTLHQPLQRVEGLWSYASSIKFIGPTNPIARDLFTFPTILSGRNPTRFLGSRLGGLEIQDAYIYPIQNLPECGSTMSRDEVTKKVVELLNRNGGTASVPTVRLVNEASFHGLPFGLERNGDSLVVKFIDQDDSSPRIIPITEIASID